VGDQRADEVKYSTSPTAAAAPSAGTANPASSPKDPNARNVPSTGTHDRGTRFTSAWA